MCLNESCKETSFQNKMVVGERSIMMVQLKNNQRKTLKKDI